MTKLAHLYSPYDAPMWESVAGGQLKLQCCTSCGTVRYPPGPACPECLCLDSEWVPVGGKGKILSWTVFHRKYLDAYPPPYLVVAVMLDEGPIMVANMPVEAAPNLALDAPVELFYREHPDGYALPQFRSA
jgi:uncharacterized OB-fold protein